MTALYNRSMPRPGTTSYRSILAVKLADLGDLLTVTPALQALRAAHPAARIDLLAPPTSAHLLKEAPFVSSVITFDKFAFDSLSGLLNPRAVLHTLRFLFGLRLAHYDALAIFHHYTSRWGALKFTVLSAAAGAPVRAGLDNGRGRFLTRRAVDGGFGGRHEADYWLQVAGLLGASANRGWRASVPIEDADRDSAATLLHELGMKHARPLVAVHPGAGAYSPARIWPLEGFARIARELAHTHGASVLVLGGPDEAELARKLVSEAASEQVVSLAGRTTIHQSAAILEKCDLFVGNDSGPMHLAATVGTPVVAVFGPSNARAWGPYTPPGADSPHTIVGRDLPCMPCFYRAHSLGLREGCGPRPCLTGLPAERVLEACTAVIMNYELGFLSWRSAGSPQTYPPAASTRS